MPSSVTGSPLVFPWTRRPVELLNEPRLRGLELLQGDSERVSHDDRVKIPGVFDYFPAFKPERADVIVLVGATGLDDNFAPEFPGIPGALQSMNIL